MTIQVYAYGDGQTSNSYCKFFQCENDFSDYTVSQVTNYHETYTRIIFYMYVPGVGKHIDCSYVVKHNVDYIFLFNVFGISFLKLRQYFNSIS